MVTGQQKINITENIVARPGLKSQTCYTTSQSLNPTIPLPQQETAYYSNKKLLDCMAWLQTKFKNFNIKVNQIVDHRQMDS